MRLRDTATMPVTEGGWVLLGERPGESIALGLVGKFWRPVIAFETVARDDFRDFAEPGFAKTVYELSVHGLDDGRTLLTGLMRTATTDEHARRWFRRYWTLGVGSGAHVLVRGVLEQARETAEERARQRLEPVVMTADRRTPNVLIAGGGIAALELLLALRVLAGPRITITLLTANPQLAPRAMSVAEPFGRGGGQEYDWAPIAREQEASLVLDALVAVDVDERIAFTHGGRRMPYDILALATGARRTEPFAGALTFGAPHGTGIDLRRLVAHVLAGDSADIAFALPTPSSWPLPLYELAMLSAHELREHGCDAHVTIVTPEEQPLGLFGPAARTAVEPMLDALGIEL